MGLLPFLAVATLGAIVAAATARRRRIGTVAGFGAVLAALVAILLPADATPLALGGTALVATPYLRLVVGLALGAGLLLLVVTRLGTWQPAGPPTLLAAALGITLAAGLSDPSPALLAAAAATLATSILALGSPAAPSRVRALAREARGAVTAAAGALVAAAVVAGPGASAGGPTIAPAVAGLVLLLAALVLAHRFGAIPLHARTARLADAAPSSTFAVLVVLVPVGWVIALLAWAPGALGPYSAGMGLERALIVGLALATIVLGTVAALVQDEVEHVIAYTVALEAGVALLAFAALDPGVAGSARTWLIVFLATRLALVGWAIAFRSTFGTGRLAETAGWARRAPALATCLVIVLVAAVGWPGIAAWDARLAVLQGAAAGPALLLAYLGTLGTGLALARMLAIGAARPSRIVIAAPGELPRLPAPIADQGAPGSPVRPGSTAPAAAGGAGTARPGSTAQADATGGAGGGDARRSARGAGTVDPSRRRTVRFARDDGLVLLRLNRTPLRAFAAVLLAGLALLVAVGGFGVSAAASAPGPVSPTGAPTPSPIVALPGPPTG